MTEESFTDPRWRVGLLDPNGVICGGWDAYARLSTPRQEDAEADFNNPRTPPGGWDRPVSAVVLYKWNIKEGGWEEVKRRKTRRGECQ